MTMLRTIKNSGPKIRQFIHWNFKTRHQLKIENFTLIKFFHSTNNLNKKIYLQCENKYAHSILEKCNNYQIFVKPQLLQEHSEEDLITDLEPTSDSVLNSFQNAVHYCAQTGTCISDDRFDKLVDTFVENCSKFNNDQLKDSLKLFNFLPPMININTKNFVELWSVLDDLCVNRLETFTFEERLFICDCWYSMGLGRVCKFIWETIKRLGRTLKRLTPQQLVQTMFFCNIIRKPVFDMIEFELRFNDLIDQLSIDEIAVISMGFFKTQTRIKNGELVDKMYRRLIKETQTIEDISLVNILKVLRYSSKLSQVGVMMELLDKLMPEIPRISLLSCLHIALMGCDAQQCHEPILELVIQRLAAKVETVRIKDMERMCHVIGLLDFKSTKGTEKEFCQKVIDHLKENSIARCNEIMEYPRCYPALLHYLTLCGFHDEELISAALDQKFISHAYGRNMLLAREIFCLDSFAKINLKKSYQGNMLQDRQRRTMGKCLTSYIPRREQTKKLSVTDRILLEVAEICEEMFRFSYLKHVIPHFERPDLVMAYNKVTHKAIPISEECPTDYQGTILFREEILKENANDSNIEVFVVVVGGWNNFVRNKSRTTGLLKLKLEQIKLIGNKPILISWNEWQEQETKQDRYNLIRRKIDGVLH